MRNLFALTLVVLLSANSFAASVVTFTDNLAGSYFDIIYTPNAAPAEFTNWDLIVTPTVLGILDPLSAKSATTAGVAAPMDTFANTVFSALGAGAASYVHTAYNPGNPPFVPADPKPTVGGTPSQLNWSIFDTNTGDTNIAAPYHMARVMYTQGGAGTVVAKFFDTSTAGIGETFNFTYGGTVIPEPATISLVGMSLIGLVLRRRNG